MEVGFNEQEPDEPTGCIFKSTTKGKNSGNRVSGERFSNKGTVRGFDNFTAIIEMEQRQQMIYKHAISTVSPVRR